MPFMSHHHLFSDGSALGNPGPGGFASVVVIGEREVVELGGASPKTTNNRMELTGLIEGLKRLAIETGEVMVYTDSTYVLQGATKWVFGWIRNGWRTSTGGDVLNRDLWERVAEELAKRKTLGAIEWIHVPGHAGVAGNERCDEIATTFARGETPELYAGPMGEYAIDIMNIGADHTKKAAKSRSSAKAYSYLSLVGSVPMRHRTWKSCEDRVRGVQGARYRKTVSAEDEKAILESWGVRSDHIKTVS
jgi:ribonuclease HI